MFPGVNRQSVFFEMVVTTRKLVAIAFWAIPDDLAFAGHSSSSSCDWLNLAERRRLVHHTKNERLVDLPRFAAPVLLRVRAAVGCADNRQASNWVSALDRFS